MQTYKDGSFLSRVDVFKNKPRMVAAKIRPASILNQA